MDMRGGTRESAEDYELPRTILLAMIPVFYVGRFGEKAYAIKPIFSLPDDQALSVNLVQRGDNKPIKYYGTTKKKLIEHIDDPLRISHIEVILGKEDFN